MNVAAFRPLTSLATLRISNIDETVATKLCETLPTVDEISTSKFNLSCFELMSGASFEESTIKENLTIVFKPIPRPVYPKMIKQESSSARLTETLPVSTEKPDHNNSTPSSTNSTMTGDGSGGLQKADSINNILIGIIVVSACGLLIGIICRRDVCGIKTKMCRTKRPPPPSTPHNSTAGGQTTPGPEEVPLNKITVTSQ